MTVNILMGQAAEEAADGVTPRSRNAWPGGSGCRGPTAGREVLSWAQGPPRRIVPPGELLRGREGSSRVRGQSWVGGCGVSMRGFDW